MKIYFRSPSFLLTLTLSLATISAASAAEPSKEAKILEGFRAAPSGIAAEATVRDWDGSVLKAGGDVWTCYPAPAMMPNSPMCLDAEWNRWAQAWAGKKPFKTDRVAFAYMLMGDSGGSNTDPHHNGPTEDNEWVVEGPHLMMLVPDEKMLNGLPDDPSAGPYVMWKGTPYVHVMVPVR